MIGPVVHHMEVYMKTSLLKSLILSTLVFSNLWAATEEVSNEIPQQFRTIRCSSPEEFPKPDDHPSEGDIAYIYTTEGPTVTVDSKTVEVPYGADLMVIPLQDPRSSGKISWNVIMLAESATFPEPIAHFENYDVALSPPSHKPVFWDKIVKGSPVSWAEILTELAKYKSIIPPYEPPYYGPFSR